LAVITHSLQFKKLSGSNKNWQRKGVSGKKVNYTFCDNCATLMVVDAEAFTGMKILKPGTLDDKEVLDSGKPVQEIFVKNRPKWCAAIDGAEQKDVA